MAWVREKNPKRKPSAPQRDPKDALEGLLSYLACKPAPGINVQRYLRETSLPKHDKPEAEIVPREPTLYDDDNDDDDDENQDRDEEEYDVASLRSQRTRSHRQHRQQHHHHHHSDSRDGSPPPPPLRRAEAPRHVSSGEARLYPYRPKTSVQARRVVSSWSNATTPLVI